MLYHHFRASLALALGFAVLQPALAQTAAAGAKNTLPAAAINPDGPVDRRIERIRIQDSGARIDELRVGGETQSITVSPTGGMPAYDIAPASANHGPTTQGRTGTGASGGARVWKVLGF